MWVPLQEKEKNNKKVEIKMPNGWDDGQNVQKDFFYFFFSLVFLRFMETCPSDFVGINTKSVLRDEG